MGKDIQFSEDDKVSGTWMKFQNFGDRVKGTLVGKSSKVDNYDPNKLQNIYEISDVDDNIILVGGRPGIDNQMKHIKIGQIIEMVYERDIPPKYTGMNPTKIIQVYSRKDAWDEEFLQQREQEKEMGLINEEQETETAQEDTSQPNESTAAPSEEDVKVEDVPFKTDEDKQNAQEQAAQSSAQQSSSQDEQTQKREQITKLAQEKLGIDTNTQDVSHAVMEHTKIAYIPTNYDKIIEYLQSL